MLKNLMRTNVKLLRDNLTRSQVEVASEIIRNKVLSVEQVKTAKTVFCYMNFANEVETNRLVFSLLKNGKKVALPAIINGSIVVINITSLDKLIKNNYNIYEPIYCENDVVKLEEVDVAIVPMVAFDANLNRLGFGKGYYDRFFNQMKKQTGKTCFKVGLAYEVQKVEQVETNEFDVAMDMIITETTVYQNL